MKVAADNQTIKLFNCDLNWKHLDANDKRPAEPQDWAYVCPGEYVNWHRDFGNNAIIGLAYAFGGYALYPTKLGAVAPGPGAELTPRLFDATKKAGMQFWSYFSVNWDIISSAMRGDWTFPKCPPACGWNVAPESGWTDLLCARIREFLGMYKVDWILFDMFLYGAIEANAFKVQPAKYIKQPFLDIIGRPMPEKSEDITPAENLKYKREVLARQFYSIRDAVKQTAPQTKIIFNMPYLDADEPLWQDHPVMTESDGLFAECSRPEVLEWLLRVRKPNQRVMTTIIGHTAPGWCDPNLWRKWHARGCDFFGYGSGTPPEFRPHPVYNEQLEIVREAFKQI